ncbi:hypothetical protein JCM33374_g2089 [Metschnikowia sp. JCM 33374]|nr:hypothetical protein JCM33374_g2089 [Metschnikowia sp. JCM 33374]
MSHPLKPTFHGYILSNEDALLVIGAALANEFPLVQRRPLDSERPDLIRSGNVFVFIEENSDIKRWTDGIAWSASRILGRFLIYRKLDKNGLLHKDDKRRARNSVGKRKGSKDSQIVADFNIIERRSSLSSQLSKTSTDLYSHYDNTDVNPSHNHDSHINFGNEGSSRANSPVIPIPVAQDRGLIKKTLSLTIPASQSDTGNTKTVHLISYFSAYDVIAGNLVRPSQTHLHNNQISPSLWSAIKTSSLGGKILIDNDANLYLDSNYQLQNMTVLLVNEEKMSKALQPDSWGQFVKEQPRRFSSAYPSESAKSAPLGSPLNVMSRPTFRAPLSAPLRSPSLTSSGSDQHFFPEPCNAPYTPARSESESSVKRSSEDEPSRKRSRSLTSDPLNPLPSSLGTFASEESKEGTKRNSQATRKQSGMLESYVPSSLHHPNFGGEFREIKQEYTYPSSSLAGGSILDSDAYGPDMFKGLSNAPLRPPLSEPMDNYYEPFSSSEVGPCLNNRAFGVQVSQQAPKKPYVFNSSPQYAYSPQSKWDVFPTSIPLGVTAQKLEPLNDDIDHEHHEIYEFFRGH